jgi:hypothetical protein
MYCLNPPLSAAPEGDWFCPVCVPKKERAYFHNLMKSLPPCGPEERTAAQDRLSAFDGFFCLLPPEEGADTDLKTIDAVTLALESLQPPEASKTYNMCEAASESYNNAVLLQFHKNGMDLANPADLTVAQVALRKEQLKVLPDESTLGIRRVAIGGGGGGADGWGGLGGKPGGGDDFGWVADGVYVKMSRAEPGVDAIVGDVGAHEEHRVVGELAARIEREIQARKKQKVEEMVEKGKPVEIIDIT